MLCIPAKYRDKKWARILMDNLLIILIVLAVGVGVALGLGLRNVWTHEDLTKIWYLGVSGSVLRVSVCLSACLRAC